MKLLLIEDDAVAAGAIELILSSRGFEAYATNTGAEGLFLGKQRKFDMILLDLNLPDMHGFDVLKKLRDAEINTPVLILSGLSDIDAKVCCLGAGADDYVTKPFQHEELIARIRAVARRSSDHSQLVMRIGKLAVNLTAKTADFDGALLPLTGKEYAILELLTLRKGTTLTKEMFLSHLYGGTDEPDAKIIDVFVCKLRKKLAEVSGGATYIETVWGNGYKMSVPAGSDQVSDDSYGNTAVAA